MIFRGPQILQSVSKMRPPFFDDFCSRPGGIGGPTRESKASQVPEVPETRALTGGGGFKGLRLFRRPCSFCFLSLVKTPPTSLQKDPPTPAGISMAASRRGLGGARPPPESIRLTNPKENAAQNAYLLRLMPPSHGSAWPSWVGAPPS